MRAIRSWMLGMLGTLLLCACSPKGNSRVLPPPPPPPAGPVQPVAATAPVVPLTPPAPAKKLVSITTKAPVAIASFLKGRDLSEAGHKAEAIEELRKALAADPAFALALAYQGDATPGADGDKLLAQAQAAAGALPEAERLYVEQMVAYRKTDTAQCKAALTRIIELAPDDWRPYRDLGLLAFDAKELDNAIAALRRATEVEPSAAGAFNWLAIVLLNAQRLDEAMAAAKRYAELLPNEADAHDTYGETLNQAGRTADAEAEFKKANDLSPTYIWPWVGLITAQAGRGDYAAALATAATAKRALLLPQEKLQMDIWNGWLLILDKKQAEGMKALEAVDKEVAAKKLSFATALTRGSSTAAYMLGKYADSVKYAQAQQAWAAWPELGPAGQQDYKRFGLASLAFAQARAGKVKDAEKTLALFDAARQQPPVNGWFEGWMAYGKAMIALGKGDVKGALAAMAKCNPGDYFCDYERVLAQEKLGDKAGAETTRKALLGKWQRDPGYLWIRAHLAKK